MMFKVRDVVENCVPYYFMFVVTGRMRGEPMYLNKIKSIVHV